MTRLKPGVIFAAIGTVAVLVGLFLMPDGLRPVPPNPMLPEPCEPAEFENVAYIVCRVDPARYDISLRLKDNGAKPFGKLDKLAQAEPFLFAMNAGMYHEDLSPVGLYVENGKEITPVNLGDAPGNFFMKPNGVFYLDQSGKPGVMEAAAFAAAGIMPKLATQSGPMLVIDGKLHPRFEPDGESRYIRNGAGVNRTGKAIFAISRSPVSLGSFARLFRDRLDCQNALFFDGAISALHDGRSYLIGGEHPVGPILVVRHR